MANLTPAASGSFGVAANRLRSHIEGNTTTAHEEGALGWLLE